MSDAQAWLALLGLGAFHGVNPGMGWLFAVALGLQEKKRGAVLRALVPIALGHALSIGVVVAALGLLQGAIPDAWLRWPVGALLAGFGVYKLIRSRHPRWVGMRVGFADLTAWSFLMATAHGAGLMLAPVLLGWHEHAAHMHHGHHDAAAVAGAHAEHASAIAAAAATPLLGLLATAIHTLGYLVVMAAIAVIVYEKVGLSILRTAWFNLDVVWAVALVVTGVLTVAL